MDPRDLREPDRTRVGQVMTRNVFCVREDVPVATVAQLLDSQSFSGVPVVDEQGRPQGIISRADVVHLCAEGEELNLATIPARDVMSARAICVEVSTSLSMAAALMAYQRIQRVPVIDQEGKVVGMLAALDVLRWLGEADGYLYGRGHTAH
ncbi:MAG: CBS domain-containing protein [Myxococcales bacterium]|nr:CBS domain-containing protein [Myxococcales bacterium]